VVVGSNRPEERSMAAFVLVPGGWGGAWAWNKLVVPMLRREGHDVCPVTLTGLGERVHLATPEVDLATHVQDVVNVLFYEDLRDVILVGHSYAGMVITGVADRVPERLRQLVYLDAVVPSNGQSLSDQFASQWREDLAERARSEGEGWRLPPGPVPTDQPPEITEWALPRRAPQPLKTFTQPLELSRGETTLPRAFVNCALGQAPDSPQAQRAARLKADPGWRFYELQTGHNLHYSAPEDTVRILTELAGG
jgi:pimeloyl-ACP methyl ester carboxylesterase